MVKYLFPLLLIGTFSSLHGALPTRPDDHYRDSLWRHIFEVGSAEFNCCLSYPIGGSVIRPDFGNNASELSVLRRFLRYALEDTLARIYRVDITGYSSIDGASQLNERLSHARAGRFLTYLDCDYHISGTYPVKVSSAGADWAKLRELIVASSYSWRADALRIIDGSGSYELKKLQLSQLGGGKVHEILYLLYPRLRRVEVKIIYDVHSMKAKIHRSGLPAFGDFRVPVLQLKALNTLALRPNIPLRPVLGVSTNLVSLAGVALDGNRPVYRTPMANLAAELFLWRRWSLVAEGTYSYWNYKAKQLWGVSSYGGEARFWLVPDGGFRGFYAGLYGLAGDFDTQGDRNLTGRHWQAGASLGYYLPLSRHWGLGLGVRGGYLHESADFYRMGTVHDYCLDSGTTNRFGLGGIGLHLGYRF